MARNKKYSKQRSLTAIKAREIKALPAEGLLSMALSRPESIEPAIWAALMAEYSLTIPKDLMNWFVQGSIQLDLLNPHVLIYVLQKDLPKDSIDLLAGYLLTVPPLEYNCSIRAVFVGQLLAKIQATGAEPIVSKYATEVFSSSHSTANKRNLLLGLCRLPDLPVVIQTQMLTFAEANEDWSLVLDLYDQPSMPLSLIRTALLNLHSYVHGNFSALAHCPRLTNDRIIRNQLQELFLAAIKNHPFGVPERNLIAWQAFVPILPKEEVLALAKHFLADQDGLVNKNAYHAEFWGSLTKSQWSVMPKDLVNKALRHPFQPVRLAVLRNPPAKFKTI